MMPLIKYDTYVSLLFGSIVIEFAGILISLAIKGNELSPKRKAKIIYFAIIAFGIFALILTVLYKGLDAFHFNNVFESIDISREYMKTNVFNHWYNYFLPWINNDLTDSFFFSDITIAICMVPAIIISSIGLLLGVYLIGDSEGNFFFIVVGILIIGLSSSIPLITFTLQNTIYIIFEYSVKTTIVFETLMVLTISFLIAGAIIIKKKPNKTE